MKFLLNHIKEYDIDKVEEQLKTIQKTIQCTFDLLEDILLWSNSQSGRLSFNPQKIALAEICNEIIGRYQENAEAKQIKINFSEGENIMLLADSNMLKTILRNLISNAIKYTKRNG